MDHAHALAGFAEPAPSVLVSLIAMNNRELLRRCLRSIPRACGPLRYDVAVIDNGSTDGSADMVQRDFRDVRISINRSRQGFSANHNRVLLDAIHTGSHDYVCILNDDTELDPECLLALVRACRRDPELGAAGPTIRGADGRRQASLFRFPSLRSQVAREWFGRTGAVSRGGWLNGSCIVMPLATLRSIGSLDERFFLFYEDADLCRRLADRGLACAVIPEATMLHHGHTTISNPAFGAEMELQMLRSNYLYDEKHHGRAHARASLLVSRTGYAARAAKAAVEASLWRHPEDRRQRDLMVRLMRYDPRVPLHHESTARAEPRHGADRRMFSAGATS